ncbi:hypothetical protein D3C84_1179720 [compost metagenome]
MDHRIANFHAGRVTIEQNPPDLLLQQSRQFAKLFKVRRVANDRRRQLPMEPVQRRRELRLISHFHHHRGRAEHFFLQDFIAVE